MVRLVVFGIINRLLIATYSEQDS